MKREETRYDVTMLLAVHREGKYLLRTLKSLREAAIYASGFGISTELVVVLDRADARTANVLECFDRSSFNGSQVIRADHGSLGLTRNTGASASRGKYICTCDGDDLISYNTIAEMYEDGERHGPFAVFFSQYLMSFGDEYHVGEYLTLGDITALALTHSHPFISRIFAHRDLFANLEYLDVRLSDGYAYEDWHFNCELIALGYSAQVTKGTILFYRRRAGSLLKQADAQSTRQIPPSRLFKPSVYLRRTLRAYERLRSGVDVRANFRTKGENILNEPICFELVAAANRIDPAIYPESVRHCETYTNVTWFNLEVGCAYHEICKIVGDKTFDDVFLFPFFGGGGAELYFLKIFETLHRHNHATNILLIFGETIRNHLGLDQIPPCVTVVDLMSWPQLSDSERDIIALKVLQSCAPQARIHVRQSKFAASFFSKFRSVLRHQMCLFHRFCEVTHFVNGHELTTPGGFQFVSENLEYFSGIITDNEALIGSDTARIGVDQDKWCCVHVPHVPKLGRPAILSYARRGGPRLLWASRVTDQKRPSLVPAIARHLLGRRSELRIHAFGHDVFGEFDLIRFSALPNLVYEGPFANFQDIAASGFAAFIYTSLFDGMPNVVLEAMSVGLPVIAPDVGGISEMIVDGETGILLPSVEDEDVMGALYAEAIVHLIDDPDLRVRLADAALTRLEERHSPQLFAQRLAEILKLDALRGEPAPLAQVAALVD